MRQRANIVDNITCELIVRKTLYPNRMVRWTKCINNQCILFIVVGYGLVAISSGFRFISFIYILSVDHNDNNTRLSLTWRTAVHKLVQTVNIMYVSCCYYYVINTNFLTTNPFSSRDSQSVFNKRINTTVRHPQWMGHWNVLWLPYLLCCAFFTSNRRWFANALLHLINFNKNALKAWHPNSLNTNRKHCITPVTKRQVYFI